MTIQQATKTIQENAVYLNLLDDVDCEELKEALFQEMLEAKRVLAAVGVVVA